MYASQTGSSQANKARSSPYMILVIILVVAFLCAFFFPFVLLHSPKTQHQSAPSVATKHITLQQMSERIRSHMRVRNYTAHGDVETIKPNKNKPTKTPVQVDEEENVYDQLEQEIEDQENEEQVEQEEPEIDQEQEQQEEQEQTQSRNQEQENENENENNENENESEEQEASNYGADKEKQDAVRDAFKHAWKGYKASCWGQDELRPLSRSCQNWLGSGLSIVDSLSTMYVMGLEEELAEGREWVDKSLNFDQNNFVSFFESVIRLLGGFVSIYDLTKDKLYLEKAKDIGSRLAKAFDTPTGLPRGQVNLANGVSNDIGWTGGSSLLAEVGTVQIEFTALSKITGDQQYAQKAQKVIDHLDSLTKSPRGLYPIYISPYTGQFTNNLVTLGAMGDSFYEYLLKMWLLTGKKNDQYLRMYRESLDGIMEHLITKSGDLYHTNDYSGGSKILKMDHLACFVPGMLALGVHHGATEEKDKDRVMKMAEELTYTCYQMYARQGTGLAPEYVRFQPEMVAGDNYYHQRPETVEALFVLWRVTHDQKYRDWGWEIFTSIMKHCKVENGFASISDVRSGSKDDKMESFFLAETLKYLYLLFSDDNLIPITGDKPYVFNTECHPIRSWK